MYFDGTFWHTIINVLWVIMSASGPTPVAGTSGTTAAFFAPGHASAQHASAHSLRK